MRESSLDLRNLRALYAESPENLRLVLKIIRERIANYSDPAIWISQVPWEAILARAEELLSQVLLTKPIKLPPLFGIPFAVKDNIDAVGLPTTAGCPGFAYHPKVSAASVQKLESAGAILIGKTNMDQFATGLVGTRSPYGIVKNVFDPEYISGGSSSGSAVSVAAGLVSFALGTDTAGSGRVPAGFNNIVGLKPSRGLISASGVFPACRSLDCVSIFALTCEDAYLVFDAVKGLDEGDAFSREAPKAPTEHVSNFMPGWTGPFRFGIPDQKHLEFYGDQEAWDLFQASCSRMISLGGIPVEIAFDVFAEAAMLLYQGPWLAERQVAFGDFLEAHPDQVLPVIQKVMEKAKSLSATEGFKAYYRLRELRASAELLLKKIDCLMVPTTPTHYTLAQVENDPIVLNTRLGYYTNFVNLLDLSAIAIPAALRSTGLPVGITLVAKAFKEGWLATLGSAFHKDTGLAMGHGDFPVPVLKPKASHFEMVFVRLAVVGLHLSGQPLNGQLTDLDARLAGTFLTAPVYKLYALDRQGKKIPGLVRQTEGGGAVEVEVWELTSSAFGIFMGKVNTPLCIGTLELETGEKVKGFLCEAYAVGEAQEITQMGGWRNFIQANLENT